MQVLPHTIHGVSDLRYPRLMVKKDELPPMAPEAAQVAAFVDAQLTDKALDRRALRDFLDARVRPRSYGYWTERIMGGSAWDLNELDAVASFLGYRNASELIAAAAVWNPTED